MKSSIDVNIEKDLQTKRFKKDPFGDKYRKFLNTDLYDDESTSDNFVNPDIIGMNLQLRSEVVKAQIASLLGEVKEVSAKYMLQSTDDNVKKKKREKRKRGNEGDEFCDDKGDNCVQDVKAKMATEKKNLLQSMANHSSNIDAFQGNYSCSELQNLLQCASKSSHFRNLINSASGFCHFLPRYATPAEPSVSEDGTVSVLHRRVSFGRQYTCEQLGVILDHVARDGLKTSLHSSLPLRKEWTLEVKQDNLSRYLKYILPFSFPAEPGPPGMGNFEHYLKCDDDNSHCTADDSTFNDDAYDRVSVENFDDCSPCGDIVEHVEIDDAHLCHRSISPRRGPVTPAGVVKSEDGESYEVVKPVVTEVKRKRKSVSAAPCSETISKKSVQKRKYENEFALGKVSISLSPISIYLKCPSVHDLLHHRQQHCSTLQDLASINSRTRKKLDDIAEKRRHLAGNERSGNVDSNVALKQLLPLHPPCPPPPCVTGPLPEDAYCMPYSLTLLNLDEVHSRQRAHMCKWPAYLNAEDSDNAGSEHLEVADESGPAELSGVSERFEVMVGDRLISASNTCRRYREMEAFRSHHSTVLQVDHVTGGVFVPKENDTIFEIDFDQEVSEDVNSAQSEVYEVIPQQDRCQYDDRSGLTASSSMSHSLPRPPMSSTSYIVSVSAVTTPSSKLTSDNNCNFLRSLRQLPSLQNIQHYLQLKIPPNPPENITISLHDASCQVLKGRQCSTGLNFPKHVEECLVSACARRAMVALVFLADSYNRQQTSSKKSFRNDPGGEKDLQSTECSDSIPKLVTSHGRLWQIKLSTCESESNLSKDVGTVNLHFA